MKMRPQLEREWRTRVKTEDGGERGVRKVRRMASTTWRKLDLRSFGNEKGLSKAEDIKRGKCDGSEKGKGRTVKDKGKSK